MLSNTPGKKLMKYVPDYVLFDLETTSVSSKSDAVVEISAVKVMGGKVVDEFSTLVNPLRRIPDIASDVNGITDDMVVDAPTFDVALKDFLDFAGDMVMVGHNINSFDMKFICRDAMEYWGQTIGNDFIGTLPLARVCLPDLGHYTLLDLAFHYDIPEECAHRALYDCRMNQQIFEYLGKELSKMEQSPKAIQKCPRCGSFLQKRNGKFGEFWGCIGYPDCKFTKNV